MKTETVQTRQLFRISECTHTHRTGYFIMKIVQQGLYIHGKGWKQVKVTFRKLNGLVVDDQGNGFANEQWSLVLWPTLNSVLLTNQIVCLDMFWWFDGIIINIRYFRELSVSAWCMVKKVGGEQKRGIRSEKLARQAKAWTTEIVWIFVYTNTGYKRITHGFMFTYIKKYLHPRGVCCKTTYSDIDVARFTAHKKNLTTFIFVVRQV